MSYLSTTTNKARPTIVSALIAGVFAILGSKASAGLLTPDIIWGTGNTNVGFTLTTDGSLELGLRAKRRYPANDALGNGIVQNASGTYIFDSADSTAPSNRSMWSFDWGINTNTDGNGGNLVSYAFLMEVDTDPSAGTSFTISYDPLSAASTGFYVGDNATGNGAKKFSNGDFISVVDLTADLESSDTFGDNVTNSNVAQNSVNMGFLPGGPLGNGLYTVSLSAFDPDNQNELVATVSIDVKVIPAPPAVALMLAGLGALLVVRRRERRI